MSRRIVVLLVAVLLAAGLTAWLGLRSDPEPRQPSVADSGAYTAGTVPNAPEGALQAVSDLVPRALSYDHTHLDDDLAAATAAMTEGFAKEYTATFDATVRELAASKEAVSEAHVRAVGLVGSEATSADDTTATVLAYVDQVLVSSKGLKKGEDPVRVSQVRILVRVERVDGTWRLDGIDPL